MTDVTELQKARREAAGKISALVKQANDAITEAEKIADESGVGFSIDIGGYGMGGYYSPKTPRVKAKGEDSDELDWDNSEGGWQASSHSC